MINLLSFADVVSLTNSILGFLSIVMIFLGETYLAFSFILLAILADGLDGAVARKTKHSDLGEYMEAMADMISLGIAPSVFVYNNYLKNIMIQVRQNFWQKTYRIKVEAKYFLSLVFLPIIYPKVILDN